MLTWSEARRRSPAMPKILFILAVDVATSVTLMVLEKIRDLRGE